MYGTSRLAEWMDAGVFAKIPSQLCGYMLIRRKGRGDTGSKANHGIDQR
jgi:hypothetical protein